MSRASTRQRIKAHVRKKGQHGDFEVTHSFALYWWHQLNDGVFDSILTPPAKIEIRRFFRDGAEGWCNAYARNRKQRRVVIGLRTDYLDRKTFLTVLAHEMVHQWEWEILGDWSSKSEHGAKFFSWRNKLKARVSLPLEIYI